MTHKYPSDLNERRKQLAEIHMLAAAQKLDTADKNPMSEYRSEMFAVTRQRSATALDWRGRKVFIDYLRTRAEKDGVKMANKNAGKPVGLKPDLQPLMGKIGALLADMKLPWKYATAILKRQAKVDKLEWANAGQLHDVVAELAKRQGKQIPPNPPFAKGGTVGLPLCKRGTEGDL